MGSEPIPAPLRKVDEAPTNERPKSQELRAAKVLGPEAGRGSREAAIRFEDLGLPGGLALVPDPRSPGHPQAIASSPEAEAEVGVLKVHEEPLIQRAHLPESGEPEEQASAREVPQTALRHRTGIEADLTPTGDPPPSPGLNPLGSFEVKEDRAHRPKARIPLDPLEKGPEGSSIDSGIRVEEPSIVRPFGLDEAKTQVDSPRIAQIAGSLDPADRGVDERRSRRPSVLHHQDPRRRLHQTAERIEAIPKLFLAPIAHDEDPDRTHRLLQAW